MQRFFIIAANCALLAVLFIGLPAATHWQLGDWQISSVSASRQLLFWGLAVAAAGNILAALAFVKGRKGKVLCWEWAAIFAGLLLIAWGFMRGYFNFNWLQRTMLWMQHYF
jgi:hypothetical protein